MTEQMLYDRMSQMIRVGFVNARQPEKMRVKVTLNDTVGSPLVTDWLPVLCPRACGDMQYDLPDIGDQVLCLFLAYGLEQGFVLGAMYGRQSPPVSSGDKWHRTFSDGATLEYDRASHCLSANIPGTANIKCSQSITLEAPTVFIRGRLINTNQEGNPGNSIFSGGMEVMNGGINVMDGDVIASGVSLTSHRTEGVEAGNETSSHPAGGTSESAGTAAKDFATLTATESLLLQATHLAVLKEKVKREGNEVDKLIFCLPEIAQNMAKLAEDKNNTQEKQAWEYLKEMFILWLCSPANDDPNKCAKPIWLNLDWILSFDSMKSQFQYFTTTDYSNLEGSSQILNLAAKNSLGRILKREGFFSNKPKEFKFINNDWKNYEKLYHTLISINGWPPFGEIDGLDIALNKFTFRGLADGEIEPLPNGKYKINVQNLAAFAHDEFNFAVSIFQVLDNLKYWSCEELEFSASKKPGYLELNNINFRNFKDKFGYGGDFLVLTKPKYIENFKGESYVYP